MRYEFIKPFVISTIRVLDSVIQSDIAKGDVSLSDSGDMAGDIAIVIGLSGDSEGSITLDMETETALRICSVMNSACMEAMTPAGTDTIAELANMIAGNAASELNDQGFDFRVSPPRVVTRNDEPARTSALEVFQIPLYTEYGEVTIKIALRTN